MHPAVFNAFEEICRARKIHGNVLEIGATPDDSTLLNLPSLAGAKKIGINKAFEARYKDFVISKMDANEMADFSNQQFDGVLCNAVLEHDRFFWRTLAEIRRVVRIGGFVIIGTPGYGQMRFEKKLHHWLAKLSRFSGRADGWPLQHSTLTLAVHNFPGDYYRFSEQTFRELFFEGMADVLIQTILTPPRIIGVGVRI